MYAARMTSLQLAAVGLVAGEEALPRELLGDGAAAFGAAARLEVPHDRGRNADRVDAAVLVEALVLDRDDRLDQVRRHLARAELRSAVP